MDASTIYLDGQDGKRSRWFWAIQTGVGLSWIAQGLLGVYAPPSKLPFWPWTCLGLGVVFLGAILVALLVRRKYGRMRIVVSDTGLAVKVRELGSAEEIRWEDVAGLHFQLNRVDILKRAGTGEAVTIKMGSYAINQQVKEALEKSAVERGLEIRR